MKKFLSEVFNGVYLTEWIKLHLTMSTMVIVALYFTSSSFGGSEVMTMIFFSLVHFGFFLQTKKLYPFQK